MCPQAREVLCSPARASLSVLVLVLWFSGSGSGPRGAEIESLPLAGPAPVLSSRYAIHFKLNIAGRIEFSKKRIRTRIVYYRTGVDRVRVFGIGIDRSSERHIHSFSFLFLLLLLLLLLLRHYVSTNDWHARTHAQHGHGTATYYGQSRSFSVVVTVPFLSPPILGSSLHSSRRSEAHA